MSRKMPAKLPEIQRWMQAAIAGENESQTTISTIEDVILPSSQMTSSDRLAIYQRAYLARLIECMRAEYPMLCRALGQELFDDFATSYLVQHPSASYTLAELGEQFADHLGQMSPPESVSKDCYGAIIELARLEWTTAEVFNGPGTERSPPLNACQLVPDAWDTLALSLAPSVRLIQFHCPVHEYYRALRTDADAAPPKPAQTFLVVSRLDYTVRHHAVNESLFALLQSLQTQSNLMTAISAAAEQGGEDPDRFASQLHTWFAWIAQERLVHLTTT
jgi:hypothetical protein